MLTSRLLQAWCYLAGSEHSSKSPTEVWIEPTSACNLNCTSCPRDVIERESGYMDLGLLQSIARQLNGRCEIVNLYLYGEPILHPKLPQMVALLKENGLDVAITSNGTLLDRSVATELIAAGLDHLVISLDSADSAGYQHTRPGASFDDVTSNIRGFVDVARRAGRSVPVVISGVIEKELLSKISRFQALAHELGAIGTRFERKIDFTITEEALPKPYAHASAVRHTHFYLWRSLFVQWNGNITPCPMWWVRNDEELFVGNASREGINEIWNGPGMRRMRRNAANREMIHGWCSRCNMPHYPLPVVLLQTMFQGLTLKTRILPHLSTALARWEAFRQTT